MLSPMAMQIVCTPMHLLALNMYNERGVTYGQRVKTVWSTTPSSTFIRMFRFLGAYGIGGLGNKFFIAKARKWTEKTYCQEK